MKRILLLLPLIVGNIYCQNNWGNTFGGTQTDETFAVEIDYNNGSNSIEVGYFTGLASFNGTNLGSAGFSDIFITKHAPNGNFLWVKQLGGSGEERAVSVSLDANGNIFITGHFWGSFEFGGTTYTSFGQEDAFIAKLDPAGNPIWFVQEGGSSSDLAFSIEVDINGNPVITGEFNGVSTFGATVLTAVQEDVFIAKYNGATGNMIWVQQGTADFSDRGIAVCTDENANVYVTGQFSDTITFDQTHDYNLFNGVYVIKFDPAGNELWFRVIAGGLTNIAYDITADHTGNIYLTGDFTGGLQFLAPINESLINPHYYKIFVAKLTTGGNFVWAKADGSDNEITSRAIDVRGTQVGITGHFKCTFDEYAELYGDGVFNSVGYWDCFATCFDPAGNRQWARQWASSKNDKATGIVIDNAGVFLLSGSTNKNLIIPMPLAPSIYWTPTISNYGSPNPGYCGQAEYSNYIKMGFSGTTDAFAGKLIDPAREPYDYYFREAPGCTKPFVPGCVVTSPPLNPYTSNCAPDSVKFCENAILGANTNTNTDNSGGSGPNYNYTWSNGAGNVYFTNISTTGTYSLTMTTEDNCYSSSDDIYVIIYPNPPVPLITDDVVINDHAFPTQLIEICAPATILLTGTTVGSSSLYADYHWITNPSLDSTMVVNASGYYHFVVEDTNGCTAANMVHIILHEMFDLIDPILICPTDVDLNDSVDICENTGVQFQVIDQLTSTGCIPELAGHCIFNNDSMYVTYFQNDMGGSPCSIFYLSPTTDDTTYTVFCHLTQVNICDTTEYFVYDTIYVNIWPNPEAVVDLTGPTAFCDGDSALFTATGNGSINWGFSGSAAVYFNWVDSLIVNSPTFVSVSVLLTDSNGCSDYASDYLYITTPNPPTIYTNPANGLICPFDSVQLYVYYPNYVSYTWYGPGLIPFPNAPSVYTSVPGLYYCSVIDTNGCELVSNIVEVYEYATPNLYATPNNFLCYPGDTATIHASCSVDGMINWLNPASGGSATSVVVDQPGVYTCEILSCGVLTTSSIIIEMDTNTVNVFASGDLEFCENTEYAISATPGYLNYLWQPGNQLGQTINVTTGGNYFVVITDEFGCAITSDTISLYSYPTTAEDPDTVGAFFCAPDMVQLFAYGSGIITWYDSPISTTAINIGVSFLTPMLNATTTYYVENANDSCTSNRIPVVATAVPCDSLTLPNVITPNGDGTNDGINFSLFGSTCLEVVIYDRWGVEIFAAEQPNIIWYGTNMLNEPLSEGVYFYMIRYCPKNQPTQLKKGFIHLFN